MIRAVLYWVFDRLGIKHDVPKGDNKSGWFS